MRRFSLALLVFVLLIALGSYGARQSSDLDPQTGQRLPNSNWLQFSTRGPASARSITPKNINGLHVQWTAQLPEIVDSAPLYVSSALTDDGPQALVIVETTIGRVVAYEAREGKMIWHTEPPPGPRWTTSAPAIDPYSQYVFAHCLDGAINRSHLAARSGGVSLHHRSDFRHHRQRRVRRRSRRLQLGNERRGAAAGRVDRRRHAAGQLDTVELPDAHRHRRRSVIHHHRHPSHSAPRAPGAPR